MSAGWMKYGEDSKLVAQQRSRLAVLILLHSLTIFLVYCFVHVDTNDTSSQCNFNFLNFTSILSLCIVSHGTLSRIFVKRIVCEGSIGIMKLFFYMFLIYFPITPSLKDATHAKVKDNQSFSTTTKYSKCSTSNHVDTILSFLC